MMAKSPCRRCYFYCFGFLCLLVILSMVLLMTHLKSGHQNPSEVNSLLTKGITKELNEIHLEMQSLHLHKLAPSARLVQKLGEIVHRLDNKPEPNLTTESVSEVGSVDVCPENYQGGTSDYPLYAKKGWYTTNCTNAKPIRSVISILVNTVAYSREDENHVKNVLKGITETYPTVQVHLATRSNEMKLVAEKYNNVDIVKLDGTKLSKAWNTLITRASTPYVLVAHDIYHFTWLTQLERQIRVVSQIPNVAVAGGAYRNVSGHWNAGCVQTKLKNYVLEYQEGYYHSKNECMFCDYLQGPFVTKTSLLQLDESLPDDVVFEDWFLTVVQDGALIMACPDAMYFTRNNHSYSKTTDKEVWKPLAKKWQLNRLLPSQGVKYSFTCHDIGLICNNAHSGLLPVCCQELYAEAVSFFQKFADAHNIRFELDSGSVLGGVKFKGLIPWDIDGDFFVLSTDIHIFNKKETIEHFRTNGYRLIQYKSPKLDGKEHMFDGYVKVDFNGFNIEVFGTTVMSNIVYLPTELQKHETFTKANIRGYWVDTKYSPGLYARNRYGKEILKHSQSWRKVGLPHSFADYKPGSFVTCKNPRHHACLSRFPGDGDIPFLVT